MNLILLTHFCESPSDDSLDWIKTRPNLLNNILRFNEHRDGKLRRHMNLYELEVHWSVIENIDEVCCNFCINLSHELLSKTSTRAFYLRRFEQIVSGGRLNRVDRISVFIMM